MKLLRFISRIIVGLVFVFSGTVKAVDPLGSAYKFGDYFTAFNLEFLKFAALPLGILLCTAEFISGFSVLSGYRIRSGIWGVLILMIIFTPLTLILALTNPVSDCGCFGDAIHLTNWQTFGKNVILLALVIILFTGRDQVKQIFTPIPEWTIITAVTLLFVGFSLLNLRHLPLFDFLPYRKGVNIAESMKIPEGKSADEYQTTFIYEKDRIRKEFTLENYPVNDSSWKFIDQKSVLVKKGYTPPIHDFMISSSDGQDITGDILRDTAYVLLMISEKVEEANPLNIRKSISLSGICKSQNIKSALVTASSIDKAMSLSSNLTVCSADATTLKTMIRSNPGYILLKNGTILGKWSWANIPEGPLFVKLIKEGQIGTVNNKRLILIVYSSAISAFILFLLISSFFRSIKGD
ncbi:MAG: DoxX family protein [Bacteroidota bacterium]|nr:DoxX family protein [Bacteroidota bacterium]